MPDLTPFFNQYRSTSGRPDSELPHLTLLHGWGVHSLVWDELMPSLLAHFKVTIVDLPGMGNSPLPNTPYTLDFLADQVAAVMPSQTHLLGWSLGGLVGIRLAGRLPQRIQSLAMLATSPCFQERDDWPAAPPILLDKFGELLKEDTNGTLIRFMAVNCNGSDSQQQDLEKLKQILHFCGLPAPRALRDALMIMSHSDLREELASLTLPRLMLFGEHDAIVPEAVANAVVQLDESIEVQCLSGASHLPFLTGHARVAESLLSFWQACHIL